MANTIALSTLVDRAKRRANRDGDNQLDTTEWKELLAEKYEELHALVSGLGTFYFKTEATLNLASLTLPADWMSTIGVDLVLSGTTGPRRPIYGPIGDQDRSYLTGLSSGDPAIAFGLEAGSLQLYPLPTAGTYKHIYVPQPADYSSSSDSTTIDTINTHGRRFLIWGVAAIAAHRGSEDQTRALAEEKRARDDIEYWACTVAITHAPRRAVTPPWAGQSLGGRWPGALR